MNLKKDAGANSPLNSSSKKKKKKKKEGEKLDTIDIMQMNIKTKSIVLVN